MLNHNLSQLDQEQAPGKRPEMSESEEMYLITIAGLRERGHKGPVALSLLAGELAIQPVSVNQMIHRLEEADLVNYLPYKGVELTDKGRDVAARVLRRRRLWEVFLVEHLGLPDVEADALACRLEHVTPMKVVGQLAEFLGHPAVTPGGLPIPGGERGSAIRHGRPVAEIAAGRQVKVLAVEGSAATRSFLASQGIQPGTTLSILAAGASGDRLLDLDGVQIHLVGPIAQKLIVTI